MPSVLTNKRFPPEYCRSFPRKVAVAVEGIDFFHLLRSQYNLERTDDICLYDFCARTNVGGLEPRTQSGGTLLQGWLRAFGDRKPTAAVKVLGIIRDAEDDASRQFQSVCKALENAGLPQPAGPAEITWNRERTLAVGVLLVPVDKPGGCIEHAVYEAIADPHVKPCVDTFLACVEQSRLAQDPNRPIRGDDHALDRWRAKLRVHAAIAASNRPEATLGDSAQANLWDFQAPSLRPVVEFIERLRSFSDL